MAKNKNKFKSVEAEAPQEKKVKLAEVTQKKNVKPAEAPQKKKNGKSAEATQEKSVKPIEVNQKKTPKPVDATQKKTSKPADANQKKNVAAETKKKDLWASIEDGTAPQSASSTLFKVKEEPNKENMPVFNRKQKVQRRNDGEKADRVDMHKPNSNPKKRAAVDDDVSDGKRFKEDPRKEDKTGKNVFNSIIQDAIKTSGAINGSSAKKSKKNETKTVNYIVEEPEEQIVKSKTFPSKKTVMANLFDDEALEDFDGLDSDILDEDDDELDEMMSGEDEELEDEDLLDEEFEDEEIDADMMRMNPEDICEVIDDSDVEIVDGTEDVDEELYSAGSVDELDEEEHEHEGNCCAGEDSGDESDVSELDAESDGEGNLGEDRTAGKFNQKVKAPTMDFDNFPFSDEDSTVTATRAFAWMVTPCDVQTFFSDFFQSNCLVVKRNCPGYYGNLFSSERFSQLLKNNYVKYGDNINVAEYKNSIRITPNGEGRVYPHHVTEHLKLGRSVQLVNPQTFDSHIWYLCEVLQELFGCFVGANTYLTPAGSAGFAPHWDEIDAFLLQVEGKKYWKVYAPRDDDEELPRDSSGNFTEKDMKNRKPTFEGWVEAGDMLYIPRGFIHQANTSKDVYSLHVTVSSGRQWAFADLMEKILPDAISELAQSRLKMRRSLPVGLMDMGGVLDQAYAMEENFEDRFKAPLDRHMSMLRNFVADHCMDSAVDIMSREFMKTALPPMLTPTEEKLSVIGHGSDLLSGNTINFTPGAQIRLIRRHGQRLVFESEERCFLVHRTNNSRLYEGREEQTVDLPTDYADLYAQLLGNYPEWMRVDELALDGLTKEDRQSFCSLLFNKGLLMAQQPNKKSKKK